MRPLVRIDLRVVAGAGDGNVGQSAINEFLAGVLGVHVDEDAVGGLPLTAMARYRVAVVEMPVLIDVERYNAA